MKPRICEVLGVEVGQRFTVDGYCPTVKAFWITEDGLFETDPPKFPDTSCAMMQAINHPDRIIRKPRFTKEEVAFIRRIPAAKYISRDLISNGESTVDFWTGAPDRTGGVFVGQRVAMVPADFVPSLRPGQAIPLSDITGERP